VSQAAALVAAAGAGYLLGAIPSGVLVARLVGGADPRLHGSRRTGATNVLRTLGPAAGVVVLALDLAKGGVAAVVGATLGGAVLARSIEPEAAAWFAALAATAAVAGHVWSVFLRFGGGRGVATAAGGLAVMAPIALGVAAAAMVLATWRTRYVSLGSLTGAIAAPLAVAALISTGRADLPTLGFAAVAGSLVVISHRDNIARLRAGTERRLGERERR